MDKNLRIRKLSKLEIKKVEASAAQKGGLGRAGRDAKIHSAVIDSVWIYGVALIWFSAV